MLMLGDKLAVSTWAFRQSLKDPDVGFAGLVDFLFQNGIKYAELNSFFLDSPGKSPPLLKRVVSRYFGTIPAKQAIEMLGTQSIIPALLTIDATNLFQTSQKGRDRQLTYVRGWLDLCRDLGIPGVRVDIGNPLLPTSHEKLLSRLVATFKPVLAHVEEAGMNVVLENHFGPSSSPALFQAIADEIHSPSFGILLDCGNFKPRSAIYDSILVLKDRIKHVHVKTYQFGTDGEDALLDYTRIFANLRKVGFDGFLTIEYEGKVKKKGDDMVATKRSIDLVRRLAPV
jgi:sugar phosphate isomerase/epimerase